VAGRGEAHNRLLDWSLHAQYRGQLGFGDRQQQVQRLPLHGQAFRQPGWRYFLAYGCWSLESDSVVTDCLCRKAFLPASSYGRIPTQS
jgi:hypothetical protein